MNLRASPEKSCASTPTTTTPCSRYCCHAASSRGASDLHGAHHEAQKLSTTTLPRSEASESFPGVSSRDEVEVRRRRPLRPPSSACDALVLVDDLPDEQREQAGDDDDDRQPLAGRASAADGTRNYAGTM